MAAPMFDPLGTQLVDVIHASAKPLYDELVDCLSHFPWKELTEGWFQFGLMRSLCKAGYSSYPEYHLENLSSELGGKADIAIFKPAASHKHPYAIIEVKCVGSIIKGFRTDASRLTACAEQGVIGVLVYFSTALLKADAEKECQDARLWTKTQTVPFVRNDLHEYEAQQCLRLADDRLQDRCWAIVTATFAPPHTHPA